MVQAVFRDQWSVRDLLNTSFPDPNWVIEGILPEGLTFFAGRPKVGKSWLALQIAGAVGSGGTIFNRQVEQRNVLYIALEDNPRRLKERIQKQGISADTSIIFVTSIKPLDDGGLDELKSMLEEHKPGLVIIDTFSRAIRRADQMDERDMKGLVGDIQSFALTQRISIVFIDHHRKGSENSFADPIDDILGSTAKAAAADGAMGLYKERGKHTATFKVTGRDVEEQEFSLQWNGPMGCWEMIGMSGPDAENTNKGRVLRAVRTLDAEGKVVATKSIAEYLDMDEGNVSRYLADLVAEDLIVKADKQGKLQPYQPA